MKRRWIPACALALIAAAGVTQTSAAPVDMAAILGPSPAPASCTLPAEMSFVASRGNGLQKSVTCTASCGSGASSVSCTSAGTCTAVDRNCAASERGYVSCNGVTTYCALTCTCTEGSYRTLPGSSCCENGNLQKYLQQCVNGQWQDTGDFICLGTCKPL